MNDFKQGGGTTYAILFFIPFIELASTTLLLRGLKKEKRALASALLSLSTSTSPAKVQKKKKMI